MSDVLSDVVSDFVSYLVSDVVLGVVSDVVVLVRAVFGYGFVVLLVRAVLMVWLFRVAGCVVSVRARADYVHCWIHYK